MVKSACWEHIGEPHVEIPRILSTVDISDLPELARKASRPFFGGKKNKRPSIPKQDFYMRGDNWDAHTSFLEYYLVRYFGRWIRTELATGWRSNIALQTLGDRLVVGLFDAEFIGEPIIPNTEISIELEVRGIQLIWSEVPNIITLPRSRKPIWNIRLDRIVNIGRILTTAPSPMLVGRIKLEQQILGHFRSAIAVDGQPVVRADHFIFDRSGDIIGRICLDHRWLSTNDLHRENHAAKRWTRKHAMSMAIGLGRQLGYKILAKIEADSIKKFG